MTRENHIWIDIYLGGRIYAARLWPSVPRQGDRIELKKPGPDGKRTDEIGQFIVDAVVWGSEGDGLSRSRVALVVSATE